MYVINSYVAFITRSSGSCELYLKKNLHTVPEFLVQNLIVGNALTGIFTKLYEGITLFFFQNIWDSEFEYHNDFIYPIKRTSNWRNWRGNSQEIKNASTETQYTMPEFHAHGGHPSG